ncbi:radical SAM protein [Candidatus Micrarchaeota archaeon]|nr:radical SAM protein [Candidatus Micrarchaeota archaeon]
MESKWFLCNRRGFEPVYLKALESGLLEKKAGQALRMLEHCSVCPRNCGVNRLEDENGFCRVGRNALVSSFVPHHGEEKCLRGCSGSGTIFFSGCNLRCVFCQNCDISWLAHGRGLNASQIADCILGLQEMGCHNINLVTPEHVVPQVIESIFIAANKGLRLPVVYNSSSYDSLECLKLLDGVVDVYMPDFKLWSEPLCSKYLGAKDYALHAREAIKEMHRQVGELKFDENGLVLRGVLVRHLVMPGLLSETEEIMRFLASVSKDIYVNVMDQYYPAGLVSLPEYRERFRELYRIASRDEWKRALALAKKAGLHRFENH